MTPQKKQKLLLISCSGGMGHIRAAEALKAHAEKFYPDIICEHFNAAEYSGWFLNTSLVKSYEFLIKNHPKVFGALFKLADTTMGKKYIQLHHPLLRKSGEPLLDAIERFNPDRIIVTHPIVMPLLEKLPPALPLDLVVTDYYANKIWLHPNIRHFFVPTEEMKEELKNEHLSIIVSGIPLHPVFFETKDTSVLRNKYHLSLDHQTILVMSGGQGLIDTSTIVRELLAFSKPLNIVVIAGKGNTAALAKLKKLPTEQHTYRIIEFTSAIDEYMRISDLIITKPGGLTITECLYLKKPLLLINPIPGQEEANAEYIAAKHFGLLAKDHSEILHLTASVLAGQAHLIPPPDRANPNELILNV